MIGCELEQSGWRQCSIFKDEDAAEICAKINAEFKSSFVLVVASQSCDIANNNLELEPYVEVYAARLIEKPDGNNQHNKNARVLHTQFTQRVAGNDVSTCKHIEIRAFEKLFVPKELFQGLSPDVDRKLEDYYARHMVDWLAARYSRPALPTEFNDRINLADRAGHLRRKAKAANNELSGLYVQIFPFEEIMKDQSYRVDLLGTIPADFDGDIAAANAAIEKHADVLRKANMDVTAHLRKEDQVSLAMLRRFKRFYYDDLSYKAGAPLPAEVDI